MRVIFSLLFLFVFIHSFSQDWTWGIKADGDMQVYNDVDLYVDTDGSMILTGYFELNFSLGDFSIYTEDDYYADIFIAKINSDKEVEWLKHIEAGDTYGEDISVTVDDDGYIYLTGGMNSRIFVAKYDKFGNEIWLNNFEQNDYGDGYSVALDQFDNVYISGGSGWNFFMAKLNKDGEVIWKKDLWHNLSDACHVTDISVDALGNIYFIGQFGINELILDDFVLVNDSGLYENDGFWGKMDTDGNFVWVKSSTGRPNERLFLSLTPDNHLILSGSFYFGINFEGTYIDGGNSAKPFIAKYTTDGNKVWAKEAYTTYEEKGVPVEVKTDYYGNIYLSGTYGSNTTEIDAYLEKYDNDGLIKWRKDFKMPTHDFSYGIDIDNLGYCYYTGSNNSITFIDEDNYESLRSIGIGQVPSDTSTYKKTKKPIVTGNELICDVSSALTLHAEGENIKWYSNSGITQLIHTGNDYTTNFPQTTTLYVTQTVNDVESWPRIVTVEVSELNSIEMQFEEPVLSVTYDVNYTYQWYYQNQLLEGENTHIITIQEGQEFEDYSVVVGFETCELEIKGSDLTIQEITQVDYEIYPNPVADKLYIRSNSVKQIYQLKLYDFSGQILIDKDFRSVSLDKTEFNLSGLKSGIYVLNIISSDNIQTIKIIKK